MTVNSLNKSVKSATAKAYGSNSGLRSKFKPRLVNKQVSKSNIKINL